MRLERRCLLPVLISMALAQFTAASVQNSASKRVEIGRRGVPGCADCLSRTVDGDKLASYEAKNRVDSGKLEHADEFDHDAARQRTELAGPVRHRRKRSLQPTKTVELSETSRGQLFTLGADYNERFAFKDPKPRQLKISPVMGNVLVRDGHRLDYETEPEIEFVVVVTRFDDVECKCFTLLNCVRAVEIKPK